MTVEYYRKDSMYTNIEMDKETVEALRIIRNA
jgi:hypothetical protein